MGYPTAVLNLPCEAGRSARSAPPGERFRRKVRQAKRLGVRWAEVTDPAERRRLLAAADEQERCHPDETYRNLRSDNNCLLGFELWLAAYSADGHPLGVCRSLRSRVNTPCSSICGLSESAMNSATRATS